MENKSPDAKKGKRGRKKGKHGKSRYPLSKAKNYKSVIGSFVDKTKNKISSPGIAPHTKFKLKEYKDRMNKMLDVKAYNEKSQNSYTSSPSKRKSDQKRMISDRKDKSKIGMKVNIGK